jgi:hypothetical protein
MFVFPSAVRAEISLVSVDWLVVRRVRGRVVQE